MEKKKKQIKLVEIARSFSYKLNLGNYQMADFFCSYKSEATPTQAKKISEKLHKFCQAEIEKSVEQYLAENKKEEPKKEVKVTRQDFVKAAKEAPSRQAEQEMVDGEQEERKQENEREQQNNILTSLEEENK